MIFPILVLCILLTFSCCYNIGKNSESTNLLTEQHNAEDKNSNSNGSVIKRQSRQAIIFRDEEDSSNAVRGSNRNFNQNGLNQRRSFNKQNGRRQSGFEWNGARRNWINPQSGRVPNQGFGFQDSNEADFNQNNNRLFSSTQRTPTSTVEIPGMGTPRTPCENACLITPEYNPVCGDDRMTYYNRARLKCAQSCGKRVRLARLGACGRIVA